MTALASYLSAFLREHLPRDRNASIHTCESYAYSFQLLVCFASGRLKVKPHQLQIEHLDAPLVLAFLEHLETERGNCPRSRNARLAAITSFFRFLECRLPTSLDQSRQIHAIMKKKADERLINFLTRDEVQALINVPDPHTISGIRDRAMLHLAFAAGLRVSELVGIQVDQLDTRGQALLHVMGKGRRERVLPLWKETTAALKAWLAIRPTTADRELFLNASGRAMTRSGFEYILAKHAAAACKKQPSMAAKHISPHVLRHTCAMHTLQATGNLRKVSLWLGHACMQSTEIYLRADPTEKLEALAKANPPTLRKGHFTVPDKLLAMLREAGKPDVMRRDLR